MDNADHAPHEVAQSFVKSYYMYMTQNPGELYRFYKAESQTSHAVGNQEDPTPVTGDRIRGALESFFSQMRDCIVDLTSGSVDAQRGADGSIIVMVYGRVKRTQNMPDRRFLQTFVLSPVQSSYFVLNDMFRFIDENAKVAKTAAAPAAAPASAQAAESPAGLATGSEPLAPADSAADVGEGSSKDGADVADAQTAVAPPAVEEEGPRGPLSWAALVKNSGTSGKSRTETSADVQTPARSGAAAPQKEEGPAPEKMNGVAKPAAREGGAAAGCALYVKGLKATASDGAIKALFSGPWGEVAKVDSYSDRGYAFIEFSEASAVKKILAGEAREQWTLDGTVLEVEERRERDARKRRERGTGENGYSGRGSRGGGERSGGGGGGGGGRNRRGRQGGNATNGGAR